MTYVTHEGLVTHLLTPIWRGISPEYKRKYARTIWNQFEDQIRSAAYTAHLSTFLSKITQRLDVVYHKDDTEAISSVATCGDDKAALKMLRDETTLLVLMVRVANEERKEQFAAKQGKKEAMRTEGELFT